MAILNLGNNDAAFSGSFSGSFQGDGNGLTNISSTSLNGIGIGLSTIVGDGASSATSYGNAFGKSATSTGGLNVAIGAFSNVKQYGISIGHSVAGGNNTVAVGYNAGHASGENNVLVGYQSGNSTSGDYNISLGYFAGYNQTSGTGNITIGSGSQGVAGESNQLRIGHGLHGALISGSLSDGGIMIRGQVSASSYIGDGSGLTNLPAATAGSTADRVVFTTTNGELTSEAGFTYDATTNRLTVPNLTTTTFTSSFITSSQIHTSGSNIFGDDTTDTQTLIGTTKMTGSAEINGNTQITGSLIISGSVPSGSVIYGPTNDYAIGLGNDIFFGGAGDIASKIQFKFPGTSYGTGYIGMGSDYNNTKLSIRKGNGNILSFSAGSTNAGIGWNGGTISFGQSHLYLVDSTYRATLKFGNRYGQPATTDGTGVIQMLRGGAPTTNITDCMIIYANDSDGAGTVSPHFRTEDGRIISLGKKSVITGSLIVSSSDSTASLTLEGSGSTVFEVIGSEGTLFSIDDDLDGTLLDVKDKSGIPVLQASASGEIYLGQSPQSLYTTAVISSTTADVTQSLYGLDTSSYGGAFFDYTAHSGSNARGGTVSSVWTPGGSVVFSETTTTHIGDTSNLNLVVHFSQSQAQLACYADTSQYNIKVITRAI